MLNIVKEKLNLSPELNKKITLAFNYNSTPLEIEKGHFIKLEPTNVAYVDPHKVRVKDLTLLFFNGVNSFYINTLNEEHKLFL